MSYKFDFSAIWANADELAYGCAATLAISVVAMVLALLLAIAAVLGLRLKPRWFGAPVAAFVELVRNTPFLIQIFFIYFGLPAIGIRFEPDVAAVIALTINGAAFAIEIIRAGVAAIGTGQIEAGQALGLHPLQIFRFVVLRPALRIVYPALTSQFIFLMLTSSIVSSISARELTHAAAVLEGITFRSFEVYGTITLLYLLMSWAIMQAFGLLGRRYFDYPVK